MAEEQKTQAEAGGEDTSTQAVESQARKQGWRPREEFAGNPDDFVDAAEFIERGKSWAPIAASKTRQLEKTLKDMQTLLKQQMEINHRRQVTVRRQHEDNIKTLQNRIQGLEAELARAAKAGDGDAVVATTRAIREVDNKIQEGKQELTDIERETAQMGEQWKAVNPWYGDDPDATEYADFVGFRAAQKGMSPAAILDLIDTKVKTKYPQLFGEETEESEPVIKGPKSNNRRSVAKVKTEDAGGIGIKWSDLSADEQVIATKVMKKAGLTKDQYLKQLDGIL